MNILLWFLGPIGRYAAMALAVVLAFGGFVLKQRHDAVVAERARVEQRKENDINKANTARDRQRNSIQRDPARGVPDDWFQ